jgi:hypothetical protein
VVLIERRRDTDDQGIHIIGVGVLIRGPEALCGSGGNLGVRDAVDIGAAIIQGLYLFRVDIEPRDGEAGFIEEESQRQSDITEANDSYFCGIRTSLGNVAHEDCRCMTLSLLPEPTWLLPLALLSALITHSMRVFLVV